MKINEIICEDEQDFDQLTDDTGSLSDEWEPEPGTGDKTVMTVASVLRDLIAQGHTEVDPTVVTNAVVKATSKPFLLKDLIALNNQNDEIRKYVDSINPSKVKFSSEILTVKNEDPAKEQSTIAQKNAATVSNMASRAASSRGI